MAFGAAIRMMRVAAIAFAAIAATPFRSAPTASRAPRAALPPSALSVWTGRGWREWWRSDAAPDKWVAPHNTVADAMQWRRSAAGVEWGELRLAGVGEARRLRAIAVRIDPRVVRLRLDTAFTARGERANWTIDDARADAIVAVNVGQFIRTLPWGWVVLDGHEFLTPGRGPLSTAVAVDSSGSVRWIGPDGLADPAVRRGVVAAFQSYPTLLDGNGDVPAALREPGRGIDVEHRDARLGIGQLADGRLLIVLTRFDGLGEPLGLLPFGPTIPEFAALMGALGARQAVALDGGISGQMLVRDADDTEHAWRGMRRVPMALVAIPR
ncbi:MAG TPA: phosphodiester glycosidase family protein [Gemmatimonadaceae bacterium]|nr:phosphodiester glycosidase family protein [Gemmatimonadaceae bacterium]